MCLSKENFEEEVLFERKCLLTRQFCGLKMQLMMPRMEGLSEFNRML